MSNYGYTHKCVLCSKEGEIKGLSIKHNLITIEKNTYLI